MPSKSDRRVTAPAAAPPSAALLGRRRPPPPPSEPPPPPAAGTAPPAAGIAIPVAAPPPPPAAPPARTTTTSTSSPHEWRSEGQRLLCEIGATGTATATIASRVGCTRQAVMKWADGLATPELRHRVVLERELGIPMRAWAQRVGAEAEPEAAPAPSFRADHDGREPTVLEDCSELLRHLRVQLNRADLTSRERVQLTEAFSRAVTRKAKLERERETLEDRVVRSHPAWRRLRAAILEALAAHPAAARDVQLAIERVLGAEQDARTDTGEDELEDDDDDEDDDEDDDTE